MTSPVDTSVKYFRSLQMAGAPVLNAQAGSLIALLDACLLNGFDSKTATGLVVASGIATLSFTGGVHSAEKDSVILVAGVTGPLVALNGEQKVISSTAGSITFATAAAAGSAAGTITFKMAPVGGWTKAFTGTNKAAYRSLAAEASGMYLRVDDSYDTHARVKGFETMTDIDTGTGQFPTNAEMSAQFGTSDNLGGFWGKGMNSSTNPVSWSLFADAALFMFNATIYMSQGSSGYTGYQLAHLRGFGDLLPLRLSGDPYGCALACNTNTSWTSYSQQGTFSHGETDYGCLFMARDWTGIGGSIKYASVAYMAPSRTHESGNASSARGPFPSPIDGSLIYSRRFAQKRDLASEADYAPRSDIPGIYSIMQSRAAVSLSPVSPPIYGSGDEAGRRLLPVYTGPYSTDVITSPTGGGITLIDVTGPWRV